MHEFLDIVLLQTIIYYIYKRIIGGFDNGCVAGCRAGVTYYQNTEYKKPGIHDDQEGFIVLKGSGMALIGDEEFAIEEGTAFIAPKGTPHTIKSNSNDEPVLVFWFHSAV